ncbi:MAG: carboxypeptidase-like regulatory domain-containing protein [Pyrinomonadaceae bacterium]
MRKLILLTLILFSAPAANAQSGGTYSITTSVVASGGGAMQGSGIKVDGTVAQPGAGDVMANAPFTLRGGFWNPLLAPTAASANIGGRVVTARNTGIKNADITLTGGSLTTPRVARTDSFGYFTFEEVEVGHFYILTVSSKRYGFAQETQSFTLTDNLTGIVFQASWDNGN